MRNSGSRKMVLCLIPALLCLPLLLCTTAADVTIYYRPSNRALKLDDWGHIFLFVRNDQTRESAYFDYYPENGYSVLGKVDQQRLDAHASLTIETTPQQEAVILDGIKAHQKNLPEWKLRVVTAIFGRGSTCVTESLKLLETGGIRLRGRDPREVWQSAWLQFSDDVLKWKETLNSGNKRNGSYKPGEGYTKPKLKTEYGRDPGQQAGKLAPNALNNQFLYFKKGKPVPAPAQPSSTLPQP